MFRPFAECSKHLGHLILKTTNVTNPRIRAWYKGGAEPEFLGYRSSRAVEDFSFNLVFGEVPRRVRLLIGNVFNPRKESAGIFSTEENQYRVEIKITLCRGALVIH